jgi:hypothetical protein
MHTKVPHNIIQSVRNAGISLLLDDDRVIRCNVTPNPTPCIIATPFADTRGNLAIEKEDEGEDPNLEIFEMQMLDPSESGGESGNWE